MNRKAIFASVMLGLSSLAMGANNALGQDQIRIVGSSTVFPFATAVAERFGRNTEFKTPIVESTGSGGGLKLFCAGTGKNTPDITNSSRRIKASEIQLCGQNGVVDIVEVKIGFDGIVLANSTASAQLGITLREIYLALAKNVPDGNGGTIPNPYQTWQDINPALPNVKIEVLGPPPTSGTRDAFAELALEGGCKTFAWIVELKNSDKPAYKTLCHTVREDGAYIEAGENDNLIVQKLGANPNAFGVFGFSFLDQNSDRVQGSMINGIAPEFEDISSGAYPISRSLYLYVKSAHLDEVQGMAAFLAEFANETAWGPDGYLADKGLIPMSDAERENWAARALNLTNLEM